MTEPEINLNIEIVNTMRDVAVSEIMRGEWTKAVECMKVALEVSKDPYDARVLAECYFKAGEHQAAIDLYVHLQKAYALADRFAVAALTAEREAECHYYGLHRKKKALVAYKRAEMWFRMAAMPVPRGVLAAIADLSRKV